MPPEASPALEAPGVAEPSPPAAVAARTTRTVLAIALTAVHSAPVAGTAVFGVVRH